MSDEDSHASILDVAKTIAILGGCIGVLYGGGSWVYSMTELLATKTYHDTDRALMIEQINKQVSEQLAPIKASAENTEAGAVVQRVQNILDLKCRTHVPQAVEDILQAQLARYTELTGRQFNVGQCIDGRRVTDYELEGHSG